VTSASEGKWFLVLANNWERSTDRQVLHLISVQATPKVPHTLVDQQRFALPMGKRADKWTHGCL
jgi:hypothetical protein